MIGIYKITNLVNNHCYIGQSRMIEKRWLAHKETSQNKNSHAYHYPLQSAFRKYGIDQFSFEVLEECSLSELNEKEIYWIDYYNPEYNQTVGGNYAIVPQKLTMAQVLEIQSLLINDPDGLISHKELAKQYGVHKDTIRDINVGRTWFNDNYTYPLHYSKFDPNKPELVHHYCEDCGKEISRSAKRCLECAAKQARKSERPSREELKALLRTNSFLAIGRKYGVSDNAIRKWCDAFNLPRRGSDIKNYTDEEWLIL